MSEALATAALVAVVFVAPFKFSPDGHQVIEYEASSDPVEVSERCAEIALDTGAAVRPDQLREVLRSDDGRVQALLVELDEVHGFLASAKEDLARVIERSAETIRERDAAREQLAAALEDGARAEAELATARAEIAALKPPVAPDPAQTDLAPVGGESAPASGGRRKSTPPAAE